MRQREVTVGGLRMPVLDLTAAGVVEEPLVFTAPDLPLAARGSEYDPPVLDPALRRFEPPACAFKNDGGYRV